MNANDTIIDVTPINYSSDGQAASASGTSRSQGASQNTRNCAAGWTAASFHQQQTDRAHTQNARNGSAGGNGFGGFYGAGTAFGNPYVHSASQASQTVTMKPAGSLFAGLAQMAVGAGLVMIGIPMLILPGPGLLSIGAGMALTASGMRKVLG